MSFVGPSRVLLLLCDCLGVTAVVAVAALMISRRRRQGPPPGEPPQGE